MTWDIWLACLGVIMGFTYFAEQVQRHAKRAADSLVNIDLTLKSIETQLSMLDSDLGRFRKAVVSTPASWDGEE